jgi:hypothetical protein
VTARRLAWSLWGLSVLLLAAEAAFAVLNRGIDVGDSFGAAFDTLFRLIILVFATIGALVAARRPRNPIGWIMAGAAVPLAFSGVAHGYAVYALFADPGSLPGADVMAWLASWIFLPSLFVLPPLLFLLFPTGRVLGPRWRPVGWLIALGTLAIVPAWTLPPGPLGEGAFEEVANPVGVEGAGPLLDTVGGLGWFALAAGIVASAASMVVRLRRSRGVERQQLKWVATAAALFAAVCLVTAATLQKEYGEVGEIVVLLSYSAIPVAAGYAILRHRLFDIDLVINRALVYGALTATLAGAYLGLVLLLGLALSPVTEGSGLAIAASTLAVAALFRPARRRVQALVDRRFYRRKYDAARTLERFGARRRAETDLDALRAELTGAVAETMQPAHVSLWLREGGR